MINEMDAVWMKTKRHKPLFLLSGALEISFLAAFVGVFYWAMQNLFYVLEDLSTLTQALELAYSLEAQQAAYNALAQSSQFTELYGSLLFWMGILAVDLLLVLLVFQVALFYLSERFAGTKISFWPYARRCAFIVASGFLAVVGAFFLTFFLSLLNYKLVIPLFPQVVLTGIVILVAILAFIISWFAIARIPQKKTFREAIRNWKRIPASFVSSLLILFVGLGFGYLFFRVGELAFAARGGLPPWGTAVLAVILVIYYLALLLCVGMLLSFTRLFLLSRLRA